MDAFGRSRVLLTDVDNTLYDWVGFYVPAFRAMVVALSERTGIDVPTLMADYAAVYQRHGSVEYTFALGQLETLKRLHPTLTSKERTDTYWDVVAMFQDVRRRTLRPYPGVRTMLARLREAGVPIYAVTESSDFTTSARLRQMGLDPFFSAIYASPDHEAPPDAPLEDVRRHPVGGYLSTLPRRALPRGLRKPASRILETVLEDLGIEPSDAVYLGDSLHRDITLARRVGVPSIWARYGTLVDPNDTRTLLKITPWSRGEIAAALGRVEPPVPDLTVDTPCAVLDAFWPRMAACGLIGAGAGCGQDMPSASVMSRPAPDIPGGGERVEAGLAVVGHVSRELPVSTDGTFAPASVGHARQREER